MPLGTNLARILENPLVKSAVALRHANTNDPTVDEKAALAGTDGLPSAVNPYVTDSDARNADKRLVSNPWDGIIVGAYGNGNPQDLLSLMHNAGLVSPTPTNILTTVARVSYFRLPADITVNKIRFFGCGTTVNIYRVAIYNADTLARLMPETQFSTTAYVWGEAGAALALNLVAGQLYFIAVSVNAGGATAGVLAAGASPSSAAVGRVGALPKNRTGSLDIDTAILPAVGYAEFPVVAGALPDPAAVLAVQSVWVGGMPAFFLDNNNA